MSSLSQHRFEILSLVVQNILSLNSQNFQLHGDKQVISQILPTAPERAYISNDCYDSSLDLSSVTYTDILQRLSRLGFQIQTTASGSYSPVFTYEPSQDAFVLQYTLVRTLVVG